MVLEDKLLGKSHAELLALLEVLNSPIPETIQSFIEENDRLTGEKSAESEQIREWFSEVRSVASKQKADNLRFRIVASIMGMVPGADVTDHEAQGNQIQLKYFSGDLAIGEVDSFLFLLVPPIMSEKTMSLVIEGLNEVYDRYHEGKNWIVDFSGVRTLPKLLLGQFVAYRTMLRQQSRELYICWLKETAVSKAELNLLTEESVLNNIGGMFFSEAVKRSLPL